MDLQHLRRIGLLKDREDRRERPGVEEDSPERAGIEDIAWQPSDPLGFQSWLSGELSAGELGKQFPETCAEAATVICGWRSRFPPALWARLARGGCATLLKETREAVPVLHFVQRRLAQLDPADGPITLLDLCSGLGFLGMLLVEALPKERVDACILMDQAWPLKGGPERAPGEVTKRNRTRLNWDHVYGIRWPSQLVTRRCDLKLPSTHAQILSRILEPAPGPVFILGVHLCGILSIRAVETFNRGPKCVGLVLKPCCLPCMDYARKKTLWKLGAHSFAAAEVCMWGKYNKNQWQGPVKASLASRFGAWANNLYHGIYAEQKAHEHVSLVPGHYQDAYLFGERPFCDTAPPPPSEDGKEVASRILGAVSCWDVLSVPQDASTRSVRRRVAAISAILRELPEEEEALMQQAFQRVTEAFQEIRAGRREA